MKFTQIFCLIGAASAVKLTADNTFDDSELQNPSLVQEMVYDTMDLDTVFAQAEDQNMEEKGEELDRYRYTYTKAQINMIANQMLHRLDKNGDGKVTKADIWAMVGGALNRVPPKYRAQYKKQIAGHINRMWKRLDKNGDGIFDHSEAVAFVKQILNQ